MTIRKDIILSETLMVSRAVKRQLSVLAALSAAALDGAIPNVDDVANQILAAHLAAIPNITEREEAVKKALKAIEAQYSPSNLTPPTQA